MEQRRHTTQHNTDIRMRSTRVRWKPPSRAALTDPMGARKVRTGTRKRMKRKGNTQHTHTHTHTTPPQAVSPSAGSEQPSMLAAIIICHATHAINTMPCLHPHQRERA
mmetsp:Transcript_32128/g.92906  ORF Transcript_32128/g.92906 Transcript_32128/m.92906 type:complete len:108 (-) Transcript_32128:116-439(-)